MSGEKVPAESAESRANRVLSARVPAIHWLAVRNEVAAAIESAEQAAREEEAEYLANVIEQRFATKPTRDICKWIRQRHAPKSVEVEKEVPGVGKISWLYSPKTATEANVVAERDKQYVRAIVNEVLEDRLESSRARVREIIKEEVIGKGWDKEGPAFVLTISKVREIVREEIRSLTSDIKPMIDSLNAIVQLLNKMP